MNEPDTGSVLGPRQWGQLFRSTKRIVSAEWPRAAAPRPLQSLPRRGAFNCLYHPTISSPDSSKYSVGVVPWRNNFQITSPTFIAFLLPATALAGSAALCGRRGESPSVTITNIGASDDRKLWSWCGVGGVQWQCGMLHCDGCCDINILPDITFQKHFPTRQSVLRK